MVEESRKMIVTKFSVVPHDTLTFTVASVALNMLNIIWGMQFWWKCNPIFNNMHIQNCADYVVSRSITKAAKIGPFESPTVLLQTRLPTILPVLWDTDLWHLKECRQIPPDLPKLGSGPQDWPWHYWFVVWGWGAGITAWCHNYVVEIPPKQMCCVLI